MRERILEAAEDLSREIVEIGMDLHAHPELSLEERRSSEVLSLRLEKAGFELERGIAGLPTAFSGSLAGLSARPAVAFLAEYDALPGIGHGCGHNLIAAAAVGAGLVLARASRDGGAPLPGAVRVIGTPAEETIGGKAVMVRESVFTDLDAALMIHPSSEWRVYADSLACATIEVTYLGKESHAVAWPEKGINALDALIQLFVAIEMLRKRLGREVRLPGVILEGGVRPNIVPARAVGAFSLRAPTTPRLAEVRADVERTARAIAEATGCRLEIRQTDNTYDDMITNRALAGRFKEHLGRLGIDTVDTPREHKGSLDMGNVSRVIPSVHAFVQVGGPESPLHSAAFAEATTTPEAAATLLTAVKAMALTGFDVLAEPGLLQRARAEFEQIGPAGGAS